MTPTVTNDYTPPRATLLSLFSGADLLARGFEAEGWSVVSAGDILWGRDVRRFVPARHIFEGVLGGSPCQDFSSARRCAPTGYGLAMLDEFVRVVDAAQPRWFLSENVTNVPDITITGYKVQRFNLNAKECGCRQNRHRAFQFGSRTGKPLVVARGMAMGAVEACAMATEGRRKHRRSWADFCELQGLPRDFDLPELPIRLKYQLVGNGVPVPMARILAQAVNHWLTRHDWPTVCVCGCGRETDGIKTQATPACRKRMQRARDAATVTGPGSVTPAMSRDAVTDQNLTDPGLTRTLGG